MCVCVIILSVALKIHMSDTTTALLEKLGGFHIEKRGEREVKVRKIKLTVQLTKKSKR